MASFNGPRISQSRLKLVKFNLTFKWITKKNSLREVVYCKLCIFVVHKMPISDLCRVCSYTFEISFGGLCELPIDNSFLLWDP